MMIEQWIRELRKLEEAAAAQLGYESDHEHVPTPAYEEYDAFFGRLPAHLNTAPLPQAWLELEAWCISNNIWFGDVDYPGVHGGAMRWVVQARSLRHALLLCILWRAQERLTRPEDDDLWARPELWALLARGSTWEECGHLWPSQPSLGLFLYPDLIANILALLGEIGEEILKAIASPTARQQYTILAAKHATFKLGAVTFGKAPEGYKLAAQFVQSLPEGDDVYLALADRDTQEPHPLFVIPMRLENGRLRDIHERSRAADPSQGTVQVHPDSASIALAERYLTVPWHPAWKNPQKVSMLCVQVRGFGPWYFAPLSPSLAQ
jgi:hypothetical protein